MRRLTLFIAIAGWIAFPPVALASAPIVALTGATSSPGSTSVQLSGTINAGGCRLGTGYWTFEYGTEGASPSSTDYYDPQGTDWLTGQPGSFAGMDPSSPMGSSDMSSTTQVPVDVTVSSGLIAGDLYYWRLVAGDGAPGYPGSCGDGSAGGQGYTDLACFRVGTGSVPCPVSADVTFTLVGSRTSPEFPDAIPQDAQYGVWDGYGNAVTGGTADADGVATITVQAGDVVQFSRSGILNNGACIAPEGGLGWSTARYLVPASPPSDVTLTLPDTTTSGSPDTPVLSGADRWIIGQINAERAARGLKPLHVSVALDRAAYATAHDAAAIKAVKGSYPWPPKYCDAIAPDWGWPFYQLAGQGVGMEDAGTTDPRAALAHWTDSSGRGRMTFDSSITAVGIGDGGGAFTMFVSDCSGAPQDVAVHCEMTGDAGDPTIRLPPPGGGGGGGGAGGGGSNSHANAVATVKSLLAAVSAAVRGTSASRLLASGFPIITFSGKNTGRLGLRVHSAGLLVARGHTGIIRVGAARIAIALTARGKSLLATAERRKRAVRLSCTVSLAAGGAPLVRTLTMEVQP